MTDFMIGALLLIAAAGLAVLGPLAIAARVAHHRYYDRTGRGRFRC